MRQLFTFNYHILRTLHTKIGRVKYSDFEHPTFQSATAPTWGDPGCRFACPVLSAPLAFIDIIGCGSAIQASLIAFALHDDSARPCKNHSGHFYARG